MTGSPASQETINNFVGLAHGDFDAVKRLLAEHPELINAQAVWGETAIQAAAQMGRVEIAEYLLAAGAPLDICTAAMLGRKEMISAMLAADPSQVQALGAHGIPLVYFPVIQGFKEIARLVVEHGAPVNGGEGSTTPLHGAVMFNQVELAGWLLDQGAQVNALNYENKTPLAVARANQRQGLVELLTARGGKD